MTKVLAKMVKKEGKREVEREEKEREKKVLGKTSSLIFPQKKFSENNFCSLKKFPFSSKLFDCAL